MSTFFGFNIARSGLFASQRALNVVSHNIANANTPGYTRQRLEINQSNPLQLPSGQGMLGTGVDTEGINQLRNEFLDIKYRDENTTYGEWETKAEALQNLEAIFNEPSETGITTVLNEFFESLNELSKASDPEIRTPRTLVRQSAIALVNNISHMSAQFEKLQSDTDFEITTTIDQINGYGTEIAKLNDAIYRAELDGSKANDLRDQRNLLLDNLSELTAIDCYEDSQGKMNVLLSGKPLVAHTKSNHLAYTKRSTKLNSVDAEGLHEVEWEDGSTFRPAGGKIKGLIDIRDSINGSDKGIPYYMEELNEFADVLTEEINRLHKTGYDLDGNTGTNLFTINGMSTADYEIHLANFGLNGGPGADETAAATAGTNAAFTDEENNEIINNNIKTILSDPLYEGKTVKLLNNGKYLVVDRISAKNLTLSSEIDQEGGENKIAAATVIEDLPGDGSNASEMFKLRHEDDMFKWGSPLGFIKSLISNLGVDTKEAIRMQDSQTILLDQIDINKQSTSGVSLDEEMANMIQFQHSFNANSRMITAIDEMIETIINRMGVVGR